MIVPAPAALPAEEEEEEEEEEEMFWDPFRAGSSARATSGVVGVAGLAVEAR
jgi:hypothetical protein